MLDGVLSLRLSGQWALVFFEIFGQNLAVVSSLVWVWPWRRTPPPAPYYCSLTPAPIFPSGKQI